MQRDFFHLLKKDFKLMVSSKFFLLSFISLILYSLYINFVYVNLDQEIYPVYIYDPQDKISVTTEYLIEVDSRIELETACEDQYSVGFDFSDNEPELYMLSCGLESTDNYRIAWGEAVLTGNLDGQADTIGSNNKEMKNRREITAEFLFFELSAVGLLGAASMIFKEKQMGVIRVHGTLPVNRSMFILSKVFLLLTSDLLFTVLLTIINIGIPFAIYVLPAVLLQAGILSLIMALVGFICAIRLPDFKQFSLFYLVLAVFVITPVFIAGQTGITWEWIVYHPMYHLFKSMKSAYFSMTMAGIPYYLICIGTIILLFLFAYQTLNNEMSKEG